MGCKLHYVLGTPTHDVLWRIEAKRYSYVIDPEADRYGVTDPRLEATWYSVVKRTPCGAWINGPQGVCFVRLTARKKFACNTIDDAMTSFIKRRERQIKILESQLNRAKKELDLTSYTHTAFCV